MSKGDLNDECNRTVCKNINATFYNYSTRQFYCKDCAKLINEANRADAMRMYGHDLCVNFTHEKDITP